MIQITLDLKSVLINLAQSKITSFFLWYSTLSYIPTYISQISADKYKKTNDSYFGVEVCCFRISMSVFVLLLGACWNVTLKLVGSNEGGRLGHQKQVFSCKARSALSDREKGQLLLEREAPCGMMFSRLSHAVYKILVFPSQCSVP